MRKVAVFVEGQAEQIFIREFLLRYYDYNVDEIGISCYSLISERFHGADYDFGNDEANYYYQIINTGGDNKVLSAMISRSMRMLENFHLIIGLRDMYSKDYRNNHPAHQISKEDNAEIIDNARASIKSALGDVNVHIHFAIMEVEAWMLALIDTWKKGVSDQDIYACFPPDCDVEDIFHPADVVKSITTIMGDPYDKHAYQVNSIMSHITKDDYINLLHSNRCPSYNEFVMDLLDLT